MEDLAPPIFLLTDFGTRDSYVGQVKAVIAGIAPRCPLIDLSHEIEPYAVDEAAWMLETALPHLPPRAVVLAVVDPGVGTDRRALAVRVDGRSFVGPDNGILSPALRAGPARAAPFARELAAAHARREPISDTFHGRDVFAPAAARLATGTDFSQLGPPVDEPRLLPEFRAVPGGPGCLRGYVVHVDRYGNLITTVRASQVSRPFELEVAGARISTRVRTFAEGAGSRPFCHADSSGFIAVALNQASAADALGARRGDPVRVHVP